MDLVSDKFRYLPMAQTLLEAGVVPHFEKVPFLSRPAKLNKKFILRSALNEEGSLLSLQSGKSLTVNGIDSWNKLTEAWDQIKAQPHVKEVIFQEEIEWDIHVTLTYQKKILLAEFKDQLERKSFAYHTELNFFYPDSLKLIHRQLKRLKPLLDQEDHWLMELGIKGESVYLFQLTPIKKKLLNEIMTSDVMVQLISSRVNSRQSFNLFSFLWTEFKARKFRSQITSGQLDPESLFLNWEFIFHYFRLYCLKTGQSPTSQIFADFLGQKHGIGQKHLELARYFGQDFKLDHSGPLFMGKGLIEGIVGEDVYVCESIPVSVVYQKQKPKLILTKELALLSHSILASRECGVGVVMSLVNLPKAGTKVRVDFEKKVLTFN